MLIRISLIVAIIAGLAVGGLNFVTIKEKVTTLKKNYEDEKTARASAEEARDKNKRDLDKTTADLKQTKATLDATVEEKNTAVEQAATQKKLADKLTEDLAKTKQERDTAQSDLGAYKATGMNPQQVADANKRIKKLEETVAVQKDENHLLARETERLESDLLHYRNPDQPVPLPSTASGKVLVSDPKWNFVVVNVGGDQGAKQYGELLVNRNGRLVAKVKISSVEKDRSVANVIPGWQIGEIMEGDLVIPAYPKSS
jgi:FtsZ-interacting cell division protein ZipA